MCVMMACMGVGMVHVRQGDAAAAIAPLERGLRICHQSGSALASTGSPHRWAAYALAGARPRAALCAEA